MDCTSLARAALPCLVLNPLKANYKTITVIAFPKRTMEPVVEAARKQVKPSALVLSSSVSGSSVSNSVFPALLLCQLVAAEAIDIITVLATERSKVVTDKFLL